MFLLKYFNFLFIFKILECNSEKFLYHNYRAFEIQPKNLENLEKLENLENEERSVIVINPPISLRKPISVIVSPQKETEFQNLLLKNDIQFQLIDKNIQETLDSTEINYQRSDLQDIYEWSRYHTLDETYKWMYNLSEMNSNITLLYGGSTYEGRDILGVKISYKGGNKGIFIEGGIHAREWISPATSTFIINQLVNNNDQEVRHIAENYDWYIFPHTNPDGYVYTYTTDRLWRKTRSPTGNIRCFGVDPNRNWDIHWNEKGTSSNPCSDAYGGTKPFSETETKSLSKFLHSLKGKINAYISFHSYSQLLLFPYGYTNKKAPNHADLQQIGDVAAKALSKRYNTKYIVGNVYDTIYPASGSSIEWAYDIQNIKLSFCYELRPKSNSAGWRGFILPPEQIIPTGEEIMDSLTAFLSESQKLNYF